MTCRNNTGANIADGAYELAGWFVKPSFVATQNQSTAYYQANLSPSVVEAAYSKGTVSSSDTPALTGSDFFSKLGDCFKSFAKGAALPFKVLKYMPRPAGQVGKIVDDIAGALGLGKGDSRFH